MRIIDLSHRIVHGMRAYPGMPSPRVTAHLTHEDSRPHYDGQAEFTMTRIDTVGNVGTYLDSPYHRFPDGADLSELPLRRLVSLEAVVIDVDTAGERAVTVERPSDDLAGRAVLFRSGWDGRWGTDAYWEPGPFLATPTAERLVEAGVALVGVDFWNVDDPDEPSRPVHTTLLRAGIPIVEHLSRLDQVPDDGSRFSAVPLAVVGAASLPIRAFAEIP